MGEYTVRESTVDDGVSKVELIAEPATDYFYNKLIKYLPEFVVENEILTALLRGFEAVLLTAKKYINASMTYALKNYRYQGSPLLQDAVERFLFLNGTETEAKTQYYIENQEYIHQSRGTLNGLGADVRRITGDTTASAELVALNESGWWLDVSFPTIDVNTEKVDSEATASWLGCIDQVNVNCVNSVKTYGLDKIKEIISKYMVPGHVVAHVPQATCIWYVGINKNLDGLELSKLRIYTL